MPEALTESFCERCGTRYEFPAPARLGTLRKTRGLVSGLKNYILSQDALSDTIEDAMRSEEETLAAHQIEAFHEAFNFCINCRQYACTNCWNESAGRCRTCVPIPGVDDVGDLMQATYLADHRGMHAGAVAEPLDQVSHQPDVEAWPESDLAEVAETNGQEPAAWPEESLIAAIPADPEPVPEPASFWEPEPVAEPAPVTEAEPEPTFAAEAQPAIEPIGAEATASEPEPIAIEPEPELHPILAWEDDAEIIARAPVQATPPEPVAAEVELPVEEPLPEPVAAQVEVPIEEPLPEPVAAQVEAPIEEPLPEPVAAQVEAPIEEPLPEPVAAQVEVPIEEPLPEPVAAEAEKSPTPPAPVPQPRPMTPISETIVHIPRPLKPAPPMELAPVDEEILAARRAQLDMLGIDDPGIGKVAQVRNVVPYRSSGAGMSPSELLQRTLGGSNALWDASAREVAAARSAVAVQNCGSCGLSLSASARFCRRCGTSQARSA